MNKVRFAIIGCGRIAKNHAVPLQELSNTTLVAVCDLQETRAREAGAKYGVPFYTDYNEMLKKEAIDVLNILTPSGMHTIHAMDVMQRYQKHVVIEKPMALSLVELEKMKKVAAENKVKIFPVYQNRYNKAVQKVRTDLQNGVLGKVVLGTVRLRWCRPQTYYNRDPWRGTWAMDGGAMTNQGIHYIDLLQYLVGDVESVYAQTATQLVTVEVEDTGLGVLKFKNGAQGVVEVTTAARPDDFEASISILAEKGTAILTGIASNQLSTYTIDPQAMASSSEDFPDAYGYGHWAFFKDVVADLQGARAHPISMSEGEKAVRLLHALYRSAEDGLPVQMSKEPVSKRLGVRDPKLEKLYTTERNVLA